MRAFFSIIILLFGFNQSSHAQVYTFTGIVHFANEDQSSAFDDASTFTATLIFDINQTPIDALYNGGSTSFYSYTSLTYQIGSQMWSTYSDFDSSHYFSSVAISKEGISSYHDDSVGVLGYDSVDLTNGQTINVSLLMGNDTTNSYISGNNANNLLHFNSMNDTYGYLETNSGKIMLYDITMTAAVPEPKSWLMMLFGFGLVASIHRRRQRTRILTSPTV